MKTQKCNLRSVTVVAFLILCNPTTRIILPVWWTLFKIKPNNKTFEIVLPWKRFQSFHRPISEVRDRTLRARRSTPCQLRTVPRPWQVSCVVKRVRNDVENVMWLFFIQTLIFSFLLCILYNVIIISDKYYLNEWMLPLPKVKKRYGKCIKKFFHKIFKSKCYQILLYENW